MKRRRFLQGLLCVAACDLALTRGYAQSELSLPGTWRSAASLPVAVQEIYPTLHAGNVIVGGGIASGTITPYFSDEVWIYTPKTDTWDAGVKFPEGRHHVSMISFENTLYAIGGYFGAVLGGIWQMRDTIWSLDEAGNAWGQAGPLPDAWAEMVTLAGDAGIYLTGGRRLQGEDNAARDDHVDVGDHVLWDPRSEKFETLRAAPSRRNSAAGALIGQEIFIAGGRNETGNLTSHEVYDIKEDRWRTVAPLPRPQAGLAGAKLDGKYYVFGGEIFSPESRVFQDVWEYNPQTDRWREMRSMITPRHGLGAVTVGNEIFVVGGAVRPGGSGRSAANEVFLPTG